eukprot:6212472-Pleurochrysis_carterae.AAC.1
MNLVDVHNKLRQGVTSMADGAAWVIQSFVSGLPGVSDFGQSALEYPDDDVRAAQTPCVGAGVRSSSFSAGDAAQEYSAGSVSSVAGVSTEPPLPGGQHV